MKLALFDVDGTLARKEYLFMDDPQKWCWTKFEDVMTNAPLIESTYTAMLGHIAEGHLIGVLTARPPNLTKMTKRWLYKNKVQPDVFHIMNDEEFAHMEASKKIDALHASQASFKKAYVEHIINLGVDIVAAYDDTKENVDMFRSFGIQTFHVFDNYK